MIGVLQNQIQNLTYFITSENPNVLLKNLDDLASKPAVLGTSERLPHFMILLMKIPNCSFCPWKTTA
jgi:hypothetical protein